MKKMKAFPAVLLFALVFVFAACSHGKAKDIATRLANTLSDSLDIDGGAKADGTPPPADEDPQAPVIKATAGSELRLGAPFAFTLYSDYAGGDVDRAILYVDKAKTYFIVYGALLNGRFDIAGMLGTDESVRGKTFAFKFALGTSKGIVGPYWTYTHTLLDLAPQTAAGSMTAIMSDGGSSHDGARPPGSNDSNAPQIVALDGPEQLTPGGSLTITITTSYGGSARKAAASPIDAVILSTPANTAYTEIPVSASGGLVTLHLSLSSDLKADECFVFMLALRAGTIIGDYRPYPMRIVAPEDGDAELDRDPEPQTEHEAEAESDNETRLESDLDPEPDTERETEIASEHEAERESDGETRLENDLDPEPDTEREPDSGPETALDGDRESEREQEAPIETEREVEQESDVDSHYREVSWASIPAGSFFMGCSADEAACDADQKPRHLVTLSTPFQMMQTELTQMQFFSLMGYTPSRFPQCGGDCPLENINWYEACAYANVSSDEVGYTRCYVFSNVVCADETNAGADYMDCMNTLRGGIKSAALVLNAGTPYECEGYRLPTEAEWEYAARAQAETIWGCGSDETCLPGSAWYAANSGAGPHPTATLGINAWDLYDMAGNVSEWTGDEYAAYSAASATDPSDAAWISWRAFRGGSWQDQAKSASLAYRDKALPGERRPTLGFRLVRSQPMAADGDLAEIEEDSDFTEIETEAENETPSCTNGPCCGNGVPVAVGGACLSDADALACTDDVCNASGACTHPLRLGSCLIEGRCYNDLDPNPANGCQWCDSTLNAWADKPTSEACDDDLLCTYDDHCDGLGACSGTYHVCANDSWLCGATRSCDGTKDCVESYPVINTACDDATACTKDDICNGLGGCAGVGYSCGGGTPGFCEKLGSTSCLGDGSCSYSYVADQGSSCNDGNLCTYNDVCTADKSCLGTSYSCNDHGACKGDGTCTCDNAFYGAHCDQCSAQASGSYPDCYMTSTFVPISAGTFLMGSPESEFQTPHQVTLTYDFEMSKYETTQGEFNALLGYNPSYFTACGANCPVENVLWEESLLFANALSTQKGYAPCFDCSGDLIEYLGLGDIHCALKTAYAKPQDCPGYRLPTEAEWEYAARAGTTTDTYNGNLTTSDPIENIDCTNDATLDPISWYCGNSAVSYAGCIDLSTRQGPSCAGTHQVGGKAPNAWGLYDLLGNALEWTWDKIESFSATPSTDPTGASSGYDNGLRGGSWLEEAKTATSIYRDSSFALHGNGIGDGYRYRNLPGYFGFRLVRSLLPSSDGDADPESEAETSACNDGPCCKNGVAVAAGQPCLSGADSLSCTDDVCDAAGTCTHPVNSCNCLIDGACYTDHQANPANSLVSGHGCQFCDPTTNSWWRAPDTCAIGGTCYNSHEVNPSNACQYCDPTTNAWSLTPPPDKCLIGGTCYTEHAINPAKSCQWCDPATNAWGIIDHMCLINGVCYAGQAANPANSCEACDPATNSWQRSPTHCLIDGVCYSANEANPSDTSMSCYPPTNSWRSASCACYINGVCYIANSVNPANSCQQCNSTTNSWVARTSVCSIGGECYANAEINPADCTQQCNSTTNAWVARTSICTLDGACYANDATNPANCAQKCDSTTNSWVARTGICTLDSACYTNGTTNPANCAQKCDSATNSWVARTGICSLDGACYTNAVVNPANSCQQCDSNTNTWVARSKVCVADGKCYSGGLKHPANDCLQCDSTTTNWINRISGMTCNDGLDCTYNDMCDGNGNCVGTYLSCVNESGTCGAKQVCQGKSECKISYPTSSTSCDDGSACTKGDVCDGFGGCAGTSYTCNAHGTCNGDGSCSCEAAFAGTNCEQCSANATGTYPNCVVSGFAPPLEQSSATEAFPPDWGVSRLPPLGSP